MYRNPYQSPSPISDPPSTVEAAPAKSGWKWVAVAAFLVVAVWCIPFANFPAFIALGWTASRAWPQRTRGLCRYMPLAAALVLGVLVITGLARLPRDPSDVHRWMGHGMIIIFYLSAAVSLGCLWHQKFSRRPILAAGQSLAILLCLAMTFSACLTGYALGSEPVPDPEIEEGNRNRFLFLHFAMQPAFIAAMLLIWNVAFWSPRKVAQVPDSNI